MALRVDYLAKETGNNLVRNPTLTVATVLSVAVSLALLGASMLITSGVNSFNSRFKDGVEFIVWMNPDVPTQHVEQVRYFLESSPTIDRVNYVNQEATFAEFQAYYADQPEVLDLVEPEQLPTSFRVTPHLTDLGNIRSIGTEIVTLPGVTNVDYAEEHIKQINDVTNGLSFIMLVAAILSAIASALLMYNTIRTGLFARRREIEVMRLVGATNWFIRIPFMMEGLVHGVIGALFAGVSVFGLNKFFSGLIDGRSGLQVFQGFVQDPLEVAEISLKLVAGGAVLGAFGAGIAVTRYLDS